MTLNKTDTMSRTDLDRKINLVSDIEKRGSPVKLTFNELAKERLYSLHVEYSIPGAKPSDERGLTYEELRSKLIAHLLASLDKSMEIYVAYEVRKK